MTAEMQALEVRHRHRLLQVTQDKAPMIAPGRSTGERADRAPDEGEA
jgi:hypothetical protein